MPRRSIFIRLVVPAVVLGVTLNWISQSHAAPSTPPSRSAMLPGMGATRTVNQEVFVGYHDAHTVTYLSTDTSSKIQAATMHINYSGALAADQASPLMYFVGGRAAANQVAVFGSEPGEQDYSPLWREAIVTWKPGVKRLLLTSDNQILGLARQGKLTVKANGIVLNCPIVSIGGK